MSTPYDYKVQIDFARDPATILCTCSDCDWKGTADLLEDIDECCLTPGDPSPAGRCPECDSLAYVDQPAEMGRSWSRAPKISAERAQQQQQAMQRLLALIERLGGKP